MKIRKELIESIIGNLGFSSLNEIQEKMLKEGFVPDQIVLFSPTGTGKTLSYILVILHYLDKAKPGIQAMVIVPSRELALQIEQVFRKMNTGLKVNSCYGGHPMKTEINNFREPPAIIIGTPGRIADHLRRGSFDTDTVRSIVLDEFDKSLELGYSQEMQFIFEKLKHAKKLILTSATKNLEIPSYTGIKDPVFIDFTEGESQPEITVKAIRSEGKDKLDILKKLICHIGKEPALIFCNHRDAVERISELLNNVGIVHDVFHGGLEQEERERALIKFRNGSHTLMITTDLAARGLDIPEIRNIIHYQLPAKKTPYIHRNGRTARMNATGTVWLVLSQTEDIPEYVEEEPEYEKLNSELKLPDPPEWTTLYISGGKKEKISKKDIVGFLIQEGGLTMEEIGLINVQDYSSFAAVKREKAGNIPDRLKGLKLKGRKVLIEIAY
jgi:superfamily II DNA/RNA helicase